MSTLISAAATAGPLAVSWSVHTLWMRRRIETARRDPLTDTVASPLTKVIPQCTDDAATVPAGVVPLGLDLADVPEEVPEPPRGWRR